MMAMLSMTEELRVGGGRRLRAGHAVARRPELGKGKQIL
jgi:hypothetical protein